MPCPFSDQNMGSGSVLASLGVLAETRLFTGSVGPPVSQGLSHILAGSPCTLRTCFVASKSSVLWAAPFLAS